ncbi:PQQ-like beta-propeller repeat protein [Natrinema marinum]|uniref:PQQ-like beta-propeller repeat protein n=1 Tax=Natrinema marinum TaxID=2961598 RepID=UPI0020C8DEF8|nr:PQQ-like beta-propeller repeat protein [Natrinema marinum]
MAPTRRALLAGVGAASAALAGCSMFSSVRSPTSDEPPPPGTDGPIETDRHVAGATGDWSSFGCNAANTREVADGKAPVDGVTERWRVDVAQLSYQAPVVAGDRVYQIDGRKLRVFDAADGAELWTNPEVGTPPLVRDGVVYVSTGTAVSALEAETGDELWNREFDSRGHVTTPATYAGRQLVCGAGEEVVALEPDDGSVRWRRDVYGQVLDHAAFYMGYGIVVATEAGLVYLLRDDGIGWQRWQLPARPMCPPSADTDSIYVNCENGTTYALLDDGMSGQRINWTVDTGWAERGIAVADGLVLTANGRELSAVDAESGKRHWTHGIGDWRHTAPAYGRDTVFVGGDRLRALDPTPGDSPSGGPALRFEREFAGRVGPGPVLDDGTIYVVAQVESETYALLALE